MPLLDKSQFTSLEPAARMVYALFIRINREQGDDPVHQQKHLEYLKRLLCYEQKTAAEDRYQAEKRKF